MNIVELEGMTVIELRKLAREQGVVLGAGLNKAAIIQKLAEAGQDTVSAPVQETIENQLAQAERPTPAAEVSPAPAPQETAAPAATALDAVAGQPQFKAAWHNPTSRYGGGYTNSRGQGYGQHPAARNDYAQRQPGGFGPASSAPRFGPGVAEGSRPSEPLSQADREWQSEPAARAGYATPRTNDRYVESNRTPQEGGYNQGYRPRTGAPGGSYRPTSTGYNSGYRRREVNPNYDSDQSQGYRGQDGQQPYGAAGANFSVNELLSASESVEGGGILDLHPDGYGFLRGSSFLASSRDIYVSAAQVRRFDLRDGDLISGKVSPQREGDRYASLLTVTSVNGLPADSLHSRPLFEELTAIYPNRKINLDSRADRLRDMRVLDLVTPLGFGQRALMLCPPHVHKSTLLRDMANVITANHPDTEVFLVLIGETPEEVTRLHDSVNCRVVASTFDQPPENHLRLSDLVMDYARRRAEMQKDVVVIVDNLTRIAKACPTAQAMQGRAVPGVINPSSLNRAKKLFGSARALREGGSITVVGVMATDVSKVDDTALEEFRTAANAVISLDSALSRNGLFPALNIPQSATIRAELMLTDEQFQSMAKLRQALVSGTPAAGLQQLLTLVERVPGNEELLQKAPEWLAMMKA